MARKLGQLFLNRSPGEDTLFRQIRVELGPTLSENEDMLKD